EYILKPRIGREFPPLLAELRDRIELPQLQIFLRVADDAAPDAPEPESVLADQRQCPLGECPVVFGDVMRAQFVRDFQQYHNPHSMIRKGIPSVSLSPSPRRRCPLRREWCKHWA